MAGPHVIPYLCRDNLHKTVHSLLTQVKSIKTLHGSSLSSAYKIPTLGP